jgi:hypothetical protein
MSVQSPVAPPPEQERALVLEGTLAQLLARASELDRNPRFPRANFESLKRAGVAQLAGMRESVTFAREIELMRGRERRRFDGTDPRRSFQRRRASCVARAG